MKVCGIPFLFVPVIPWIIIESQLLNWLLDSPKVSQPIRRICFDQELCPQEKNDAQSSYTAQHIWGLALQAGLSLSHLHAAAQALGSDRQAAGQQTHTRIFRFHPEEWPMARAQGSAVNQPGYPQLPQRQTTVAILSIASAFNYADFLPTYPLCQTAFLFLLLALSSCPKVLRSWLTLALSFMPGY